MAPESSGGTIFHPHFNARAILLLVVCYCSKQRGYGERPFLGMASSCRVRCRPAWHRVVPAKPDAVARMALIQRDNVNEQLVVLDISCFLRIRPMATIWLR